MSQRRSRLLDLLQQSPAYKIRQLPDQDHGISDQEPFPFLAIVGQNEMKLALLLALINPRIGGVLLVGPRGTAKTTAVRGLTDLLPSVRRSLCVHGCTETMIEEEGMAAICDSCAEKFGYGQPLTVEDRVRMMELPLNARLEDVVGGINERIALEQQRVRLERGILGHADGQILYIDEVNLLDDAITDAILDAASQGFYTVRRGPLKLRYRARFMLIGSMNPEEGRLRPQIMDRFGLRVLVKGLADSEDRYRAYQNVLNHQRNPSRFADLYAHETLQLADELNAARERLDRVAISDEARTLGLSLVQALAIDSNRADITLFEAARAHAAADEREEAMPADIQAVALLSLRLRRSEMLSRYFTEQAQEDEEVSKLTADFLAKGMDN
jgi:magnesium chelatase subunit I